MALALNPNQNFTILIILVISMFFLRSGYDYTISMASTTFFPC